jgi:hypothetical protein
MADGGEASTFNNLWSFGRGFDSHRPLHKSNCHFRGWLLTFTCSDTILTFPYVSFILCARGRLRGDRGFCLHLLDGERCGDHGLAGHGRDLKLAAELAEALAHTAHSDAGLTSAGDF